MGQRYTHYVFQFSFATASTTIVSGAVAERMKLTAYMVFSAVNTLIYCIPASWAWNYKGWLNQMGFFDFAGGTVVHLTGGASALVASIILGPRLGRFTFAESRFGMSSPVTALTGTFMLWWAWLAFNCGSSYGIQLTLWKTAAKVGVVTLNGSIGGSLAGLGMSLLMNWKEKIFEVPLIITSILGGLVAVTSGCAVFSPAEALLIGAIGGILAILATPLLAKLGVDDPVGAVPVHLVSSLWGTLAVGIFGKREFAYLNMNQGLLAGGGFTLLGLQALGAFVIMSWSVILTAISFLVMKHTFGIRMEPEEEILGADWVEHRVRTENFAMKLEKALGDMRLNPEDVDGIAKKLITELADPNISQVEGAIRGVAGAGGDTNGVGATIAELVHKTMLASNQPKVKWRAAAKLSRVSAFSPESISTDVAPGRIPSITGEQLPPGGEATAVILEEKEGRDARRGRRLTNATIAREEIRRRISQQDYF